MTLRPRVLVTLRALERKAVRDVLERAQVVCVTLSNLESGVLPSSQWN
jgi:hypothetical protein